MMKNKQSGFALSGVATVVALILLAGGGYYLESQQEATLQSEVDSTEIIDNQTMRIATTPSEIASPTETILPTQSIDSTTSSETNLSIQIESSEDQEIIDKAKEVIGALEAADYEKLESLTSLSGLSFNEVPSLDLSENDVSRSKISEIPEDTKRYLWGYTDGKGDPIRMTMKDYIEEYIYTHDYANAPEVAVNAILGEGTNCPNSIKRDVRGRDFVAFHFPGDEEYAGMNWTTIYLVFDESNGEYRLRAIAKANWCI